MGFVASIGIGNMPETLTVARVHLGSCTGCRVGVWFSSGARRPTRDLKGRYWCEGCVQQLTSEQPDQAQLPEKSRYQCLRVRWVCTSESPYDERAKALGFDAALHPDATYVKDVYDQSADHDDYSVHKCPNCGLIFHETLPN